MASSLRSWISEHKLTSVATLSASAVGASLAYTRRKLPLKSGVRRHAKVLTLAVISGVALMHYLDEDDGFMIEQNVDVSQLFEIIED